MRRIWIVVAMALLGCSRQSSVSSNSAAEQEQEQSGVATTQDQTLSAGSHDLSSLVRPTGADPTSGEWQAYFRVQRALPELGDPSAYFPTATGTTWEYLVTLGPREPLVAYERVWPVGGGRAMFSRVRGRILAERVRSTPPSVVLRVVGPASAQGPLRYGRGVEVAIMRDDLRYFEDVEHCFWAIPADERFEALLVMTYSPLSSDAPTGSWGVPIVHGEGYVVRQLFHDRGAGVSIGSTMGDRDAHETLLSTGYAPEWQEPCLHFLRIVEETESASGSDEADVLNSAFTEEYWFERGKGLVRMEQKVGGVPSMVWNLTRFTAGM